MARRCGLVCQGWPLERCARPAGYVLSWDSDLYITTIHGTDKLRQQAFPATTGEHGLPGLVSRHRRLQGRYLNPKGPRVRRTQVFHGRPGGPLGGEEAAGGGRLPEQVSFQHVSTPSSRAAAAGDGQSGMFSRRASSLRAGKVTFRRCSPIHQQRRRVQGLLNTRLRWPAPGTIHTPCKAGSLFGWDVDGRAQQGAILPQRRSSS
jgi:hypothetical protein